MPCRALLLWRNTVPPPPSSGPAAKARATPRSRPPAAASEPRSGADGQGAFEAARARQLRLVNSGARPAERRQAFTSNGLQYVPRPLLALAAPGIRPAVIWIDHALRRGGPRPTRRTAPAFGSRTRSRNPRCPDRSASKRDSSDRRFRGRAGAGRAIVAAKIVKAVAVADARGNFILMSFQSFRGVK